MESAETPFLHKKLHELADIRMGYPFRSRLEPAVDGDLAVVQMRDIEDGGSVRTDDLIRIHLPDFRERHQLRPGDLVFRSRGRSHVAAVVPDGLGRAVLSAPMLLIRPIAVRADYLCWFINSAAASNQLAGMLRGTAVQMISAEALKTLDVPVPPEERQRCIAELAALGWREEQLLFRISSLRQQQLNETLLKLTRKELP